MSKLLRAFYRTFIKNRFIRWVWMLGLAVWGVRVMTERGLAWKRAPLSKIVFSIPATSVLSFNIRQNEDEEITFIRADTCWLAVKNNVTIRLPQDSVSNFLSVFEKMERLAVKTLPINNPINDSQGKQNEKAKLTVFITQKNNENHSFSIFYNEHDSLSHDMLTYIKLPNERVLHGVRGDLLGVFSKKFDDFRDKTLLHFDKNKATVLVFRTETDSLILARRDSSWFVRNNSRLNVVQSEFGNYLYHLQLLRGDRFYDGDRDVLSDHKIQNQLVIYSPTDTVTLTNYRLQKGFILHSTQNENAYFQVDSSEPIFPNFAPFFKVKEQPVVKPKPKPKIENIPLPIDATY